MSKEKQVIKAEVDDIYYWVECPSCNNEQTFWGSDFNENEKYECVHYECVYYECVHCKHKFIIKLPVNKYREALQGIMDAVNQGGNRIEPLLYDAIEQAKKVIEET